jgi:hypothetical protein
MATAETNISSKIWLACPYELPFNANNPKSLLPVLMKFAGVVESKNRSFHV